MEDFIILVAGSIMAAMLGFLAGALIFGDANGTDLQQRTIICTYEGGLVKDDVCIKDGSVITINLPGGE